MLGSGILSIPLEEFSYGWEYWSEYKPEEDEKQIFKTDIKKRMKQAVHEENYVEATRLHQIQNSLFDSDGK